jgi:phage shock protein A
MADEPDNLTLRILREIRDSMATKADISELRAETKAEIQALSRAVAADLHDLAASQATTKADLTRQLASLREAVMHYHSSVIGHGVIISELEARVRRIETQLNIASDH